MKTNKIELFYEEEEEDTGGMPNLDKYLKKERHWVSYTEGARMYRIPYYSFVRLAREAEAHYCLRKTSIVDIDMIEKFLENNPDVADRILSVREV